jgi:hypothetical protein
MCTILRRNFFYELIVISIWTLAAILVLATSRSTASVLATGVVRDLAQASDKGKTIADLWYAAGQTPVRNRILPHDLASELENGRDCARQLDSRPNRCIQRSRIRETRYRRFFRTSKVDKVVVAKRDPVAWC